MSAAAESLTRETCQRESMGEVLDEIKPLLQAHWQEIAHYKDIPLAPDWDRYQAAEDMGFMRIYTMRWPHLIGYAIYFLAPHAHYSLTPWAIQDILYLHPWYRKGKLGASLIKFSEEQLKAEGVEVIQQHVKTKPELDFSPLLKRMGYQCMDTIWVKRL